ncbi:hypothetical protein U9M48_038530 [Paspalum notatum var. saurae]|uniref:Impact N-terminal domain-containing protein n=1 Tax=Paspalum notatum var. saurae TaxID=547442 RepID=A0AAQ3ULH8_PASNO
MSGSGKKVADVAAKAGKAIDWDGMAKMLVSEEARKEFSALRRAFDDVNHQLQTKFSQEPQPIDWEYYRKGIGSKVVDMYKEAYEIHLILLLQLMLQSSLWSIGILLNAIAGPAYVFLSISARLLAEVVCIEINAGIEIPKYVDTVTPEYKPKFDALAVELKEAEQASLKESERLEKEIAELREMKKKISTMTADEYFEKHPEVKQKFDDEIRILREAQRAAPAAARNPASRTHGHGFHQATRPRDMAAVRASPRVRSLLLLSQPDAATVAAAVRRSFTCASASPAPARGMASPSSSSATPSPYTTLVGRVSCEREIKRSKFIAIAAPVPNERAAMAFLDQVASPSSHGVYFPVKDPRATHNCWAYKLGEQFRYNDDGEPSSTAGKPIYSAIISSGIDMVMVVVIRYFGGIKLGTGGLVRAYGGVASECLKDAPTCLVKPKARVGMEVPFDLLGTVYHQLQHFEAEDIKQDYDTGKDGTVMVMFKVEYEKIENLGNAVNSACSRKIELFL